MTFGPSNSASAFLPTEVQFSEEPKLMSELLSKRERLTATCLNIREIAQYQTVEVRTGQAWFNTSTISLTAQNRQGFRLTFDLVAMNLAQFLIGTIPPGVTTLTLTTTTVPKSIQIPTGLIPTDGYGACTNATNFYFINDPLVFVRTNIWTNGSQTITITNNTGSALTQAYWVFEYIKF